MQTSSPTNYLQRSQHAARSLRGADEGHPALQDILLSIAYSQIFCSRTVLTVPAFYNTFRIKSRCKTPLSFKLWFPAANLKNICRGRCSHRPAGTHLPPNIPPQSSHHLKSQGRAFLHSPDFNLSSLWQHRTIPALRLKHRSDGCGTASALPKCSIRHPVLSALLA